MLSSMLLAITSTKCIFILLITLTLLESLKKKKHEQKGSTSFPYVVIKYSLD